MLDELSFRKFCPTSGICSRGKCRPKSLMEYSVTTGRARVNGNYCFTLRGLASSNFTPWKLHVIRYPTVYIKLCIFLRDGKNFAFSSSSLVVHNNSIFDGSEKISIFCLRILVILFLTRLDCWNRIFNFSFLLTYSIQLYIYNILTILSLILSVFEFL